MPPPSISQRFGLAIRRRRMAMGITQEMLAEHAGLHPTYIGLIERGKRNPTLEVCEQLAQALGCKLPTLVTEASKPVDKASE